MHRKRASDFPQELLDLFDGYVHGGTNGSPMDGQLSTPR
jgi:hypothetical protein